MNKSSIIGRMFANAQVNMGPTNLSQQQDFRLPKTQAFGSQTCQDNS